MEKIAVDIVLLLPQEIVDVVIQENQRLVSNFGSKISFDNGVCVPHVSLAMGIISQDDIAYVKNILSEIAKEFSPLKLKATKIYVANTREGFAGIEIENTSEIQRLHEVVTERFEKYMTFDATKEMFVGSENFDERTIEWTNQYHAKANFKNYLPHITIGYGEGFSSESKITFPISFTASTLALCHLGSLCACRKILWPVSFV